MINLVENNIALSLEKWTCGINSQEADLPRGSVARICAFSIFVLLMFSTLPNMELNNPIILESGPSDEEFGVVLVGNSYTQGNNLKSTVGKLLQQIGGYSTDMHELSGGGMTLDGHADNAEDEGSNWHTTLTETEDLDFIILQDQSQIPSLPQWDLNWQSSKDGAIRLDEVIPDSSGEVMFFMTWGRRNGDDQNSARNPDFLTMQDNLQVGYELYAENVSNSGKSPWMMPVGLAWKHIYLQVRDEENKTPEDSGNMFYNLYNSDGSHPSSLGTYLTACVMFSSMTGNKCVGKSDNFNFDVDTRLYLQEAADATVFNETNYPYPWGNQPVEPIEPEFSDLVVSFWESPLQLYPEQESVNFKFDIYNNGSHNDLPSFSLNCDDFGVQQFYRDAYKGSSVITQLFDISSFWDELHYGSETVACILNVTSSIDGEVYSFPFQFNVVSEVLLSVASYFELQMNKSETKEMVMEIYNHGNTPAEVNISLGIGNLFGLQEISTPALDVLVLGGNNIQIPAHHSSVNISLEFTTMGIIENTEVFVEFSSEFDTTHSRVEFSIIAEEQIKSTFNTECASLSTASSCYSILQFNNLRPKEQELHVGVENVPDWLTVDIAEIWTIVASNSSNTLRIDFITDETALGGDIAELLFTITNATGQVVDTISTSLSVSSYYSWSVIGTSNQTTSSDEYIIAIIIRNDGNAMDSLNVSFSSSHPTKVSLSENELLNVSPSVSRTVKFYLTPLYAGELQVSVHFQRQDDVNHTFTYSQIFVFQIVEEKEVVKVEADDEGLPFLSVLLTMLTLLSAAFIKRQYQPKPPSTDS